MIEFFGDFDTPFALDLPRFALFKTVARWPTFDDLVGEFLQLFAGNAFQRGEENQHVEVAAVEADNQMLHHEFADFAAIFGCQFATFADHLPRPDLTSRNVLKPDQDIVDVNLDVVDERAQT